ncbi:MULTISPECIES: choice-of-anchor J domain-containing protein [Flavobacterium]|uniref:choice-of-anchor J domain-containing protein n=1 Tax=Flavobacterium TaxID=237 RepID=UPI001FCB0C5C|nr:MULTISPECIES: choice-of-anchor J domain-containing protein [Flavobacterium]UOK42307.1 choice-of-anchor J domain-containing protein [Flavobacterium enshiense]
MILTFGLFSSSASAQGLPLENFNSGIPGTWGKASNQTVINNWGPTTPTGGYQATPGAVVNPALNTTTGTRAEYFFITPQFNLPNATEIRFFTKQGFTSDRGTTYELRLSTALQPDISSFNVTLKTWTEADLNTSPTTYEEKIVPVASLPAGIPVFLAFVAITNQDGTTDTVGDSWFIDNVRVITSCAKVTGINSAMTATGGLVTWSHATANNFEIQIVPRGTGNAPSGIAVNGFSHTFSGLTDGTDYDVYIKTICDATTASEWAGPFPVKTARLGLDCSTPIVIPPTSTSPGPYVLSSNLSSFHPAANYTPMNSQGLSCQPVGQTQNLLLGDHAFLAYTPTTSGLVNVGLSTTVNTASGCFNSLASVFIFDSCTGIGTTANCLGGLAVGSTSNNGTQGQIPNVYLQAGQTYYFVISSPYQYNASQPGASICFTFTLSQPSCSIPAGISYDNLAQTSARFSWGNPQNLVSNWQYIAKLASAGPPIAGDVLTSTNTNVNNLVGSLTPNTAYNFYVRSVCSGTPGAWSNAFPFRTLCNFFPTPYSTDFNTATSTNPEPCWTILDLNGDGTQFVYSGDAAPGAPQGNLARLNTFNSGTQTNDMLISPQVRLDGVVQKQLRFKFKGFGGYTNSTGYVLGESSFSVKISTTGVGAPSFTTILLPLATYETGNNWVEKIIAIPANIVGDISIAWHVEPGHPQTSTNFYVDDVTIEDLPACSPPQYPGVTAGSITQNQAQFFWTPGINNSEWEIAVQPLNSGVPTGNGERVTNNPFLKNGLTASTRYEYYIRTYCDDVTKSVWVGPVRFNTLCDALPVPYYESLNDTDVTTKKFCWKVDNRNNDGGRSQWTIDGTQAFIQARDLPFTPFENFDDYLITAQVNAVGTKMLKFKCKASSSIFTPEQRANFEVLMSASPDMSNPTVLIPSHDITNGEFVEDFVIFTGTGPAYFAFHVPSTIVQPANTGVLYIDDFSIDDASPCPNPSVLTASNITTTTATLSWTKGYQETQWEIAIQSPGSGTPTGSGTVVSTNPTYNATGLTANTTYEYYVKAICGSDQSAWVGPFAFKTACNVLSSPFVETFETNSPTESCWSTVNSNLDGNEWDMNFPVNPIFGGQSATLSCFTNGNSNDWLISPTITVQPNQRLRVYYKSHYEPVIGNDLKVKLSTNGADISQFTTTLYDTDVTGTINNTDVRELIINLTTITAPTNINIAFQVPPGTPGPEGYRGSYVVIDNVSIENIPACPPVINVTAAANTTFDTTSVLNWTPVGSETSWEISVQPFGTPAPVGNTQPQYLRTATTHPYTLTGLTPSTHYQFYVRAVCSTTSQSTWVGPFELLTKCDTSNLCTYTVSLTNGGGSQALSAIDVVQNGVVYQSLVFPTVAPGQPTVLDYQISVCRGIEFNLFWRLNGSATVNSWPNATVTVKDYTGAQVFNTTLGQHTMNTNIYTAVSNCTTVTCVQPTNLAVSDLGVLSWTPGGSETQWEVFVQPLGLGGIPQSGVTVTGTASYLPTATDFIVPLDGTYEFFVRTVCGDTNKSYWTGPKVFVRNDEPQTAIVLPVNTNGTCTSTGTKASFKGVKPSTEPTSCAGANGGDIWYQFVATSKIHTVELSNWTPGSWWTNAAVGVWPNVILSLYEVQGDGSLVEKACSENNSLTTMYSTELTVGTTYKVRVKLNQTNSTDKMFNICVSTPENTCDVSNFNYSFEKLPMQFVTSVSTIAETSVVPGWRTNTDADTIFFHEGSGPGAVTPYEGAQSIQVIQDPANTWDPNGPIKGTYTDIETPAEIQKVKYSFASATRSGVNGTTIELWAGPPSGPFTKLTEHFTASMVWSLRTGSYTIPVGQPVTRFIFRTKNNGIGHMLDAAKFVLNTDIVTADPTLTCDQTSVSVTGEGTGEWIADTNNPAVTVIETPQSQTTTISGYNTPGVYTYFWKTRYCEKPFTVTYLGIPEVAAVTSPVNYCLDGPSAPLTATAPDGFTLLWFTDAVGGTGDVDAPVPSTATVGTTTYYVSVVNPQGCIGVRTPIEVIVNDLYDPKVGFKYDDTKYCGTVNNPVLLVDEEEFTTGGTFLATPAGLTINPATGAIDLSTSTPGEYEIIYTIDERVNGCNKEGSSAIVKLQYEGPCPNIPRGISPNDDGDNDTFVLRDLGVKKVAIFNRYGVEVYSYGEGYEDQWYGQSNDGEKLPDGTYFYSIQKADNTTVTGWVYINRQY